MTIFQKINLIPDLINEKKTYRNTGSQLYLYSTAEKPKTLYKREPGRRPYKRFNRNSSSKKRRHIQFLQKRNLSVLQFSQKLYILQISFNKKEDVSIVHYR